MSALVLENLQMVTCKMKRLCLIKSDAHGKYVVEAIHKCKFSSRSKPATHAAIFEFRAGFWKNYSAVTNGFFHGVTCGATAGRIMMKDLSFKIQLRNDTAAAARHGRQFCAIFPACNVQNEVLCYYTPSDITTEVVLVLEC